MRTYRCFAWLLAITAGAAVLFGQTTENRVISGVVSNAKTGQPLVGADVTLSDTKSGALVAETFTDTDGRFSFDHLSDGKYSLLASHRGYVESGFNAHEGFATAIVTGEGLVSTGLQFCIAPQAAIFGSVTEDSGDPVQQARVSLYRQDDRSGISKMVSAGMAITDDEGNYEFPRVRDGNYYLAVIATPWYATTPQQKSDAPHPLDVVYPVTYYADVTDADAATPIPVKAGDRISVNFTLHPVPALHLTIQFPGAGPNHRLALPQLHQEVFGSAEPVQMGMIRINENTLISGSSIMTAEFSGVPPGQYELEMPSTNGSAGSVKEVDASQVDQQVDFSGAQALAGVTGKVAMVEGENLPARLTIELMPQQGDRDIWANVDANGNFHFPGVPPGSYTMAASANGAAIAAVRISATGATIDGHMLKIGSAPVMMAAVLAESTTEVNGFAKQDGKPAPGAMIVLVPAHPEGNQELFRRDQSDSDGSFSLKQVIPGEYTVVAIEDGWSLEWARPEVIAHYLPQGVRVTVPLHGREINLKDAVAVQAR